MCLLSSLYGDFFVSYSHSLHYFSAFVWILNVILLITFMIELHCLRNARLCGLSHAYSVVLLSMISSIISSLFFLLSSTNIISDSNYFDILCSFGPMIAISFRTMCKSFTWALYIIRGQMVMEALDSIIFSKFAKYAPYILIIQCILITTLIIIFTESSESDNKCIVNYPLWLLISSALIGELFYGLGFMYIFYRAMNNSMDNTFKSLRAIDAYKTKKQIHHHMTIYMIQLIISILFLLFVSSCICFQTLTFFEAELFLSNLCLLLLFRNKWKLCKKSCNKCCNSCRSDEQSMIDHVKTLKLEQSVVSDTVSFRNLRKASKRIVSQMQHSPNYFFSNKWRTNKEVVSIKHTLKSSIPKNTNTKILELIEVDNNNNNNNLKTPNNTNTTDVTPSYLPKLGGYPTTESIETLEIVMSSKTHKTNDSDHSITLPMPSTAPTTPDRLIMIPSISCDPNKSIINKYNALNEEKHNKSTINIEHISQSTTDLMRYNNNNNNNNNHRKEEVNDIDTHSEHLLIHPDFMETKSTPIPTDNNNNNNNYSHSHQKSPESPSSSSVKVMITSFLHRFRSKSDGKPPQNMENGVDFACSHSMSLNKSERNTPIHHENVFNNICSFSDPINKESWKIQQSKMTKKDVISTNDTFISTKL